MPPIYLDAIATTPVAPEVRAAMQPFWAEKFGNPSSIHSFGRDALMALDEARDKAAGFFGVDAGEVFFTGSATEADNWALTGIINAVAAKTKRPLGDLHLVTSALEHPAVLEAAARLEARGLNVTYVKPTKAGVITAEAMRKALTPATVLVSIMYVNNEVGAINPITAIGRVLEAERARRRADIYFHTDAVQAVQFLECRRQYLKVDALTFSGHKIYGPKGVGGLVVREGVPMEPLIVGGGQENERRSGTENVPAIVGLGRALALAEERREASAKQQSLLQKRLTDGILKTVPRARLNGPPLGPERVANNVNVCFAGADGEALLMALDLAGVAASSGSACSSGATTPSHVLTAMGLSPQDARASIRFGLSRHTSRADIDRTIKLLPELVAQARRH